MKHYCGCKLEVSRDNIVRLHVDAIVNAANTSLLGGGGVDGAIHRAAGPDLVAECRTLRGCKTGVAKITKGYRLPAKHVIHTVGPAWNGGQKNEPELLSSCYRESMRLGTKNACKSMAFPAISCGVYGYPLEAAAQIAITTVLNILREEQAEGGQTMLEHVIFCCFDAEVAAIYNRLLPDIVEAR